MGRMASLVRRASFARSFGSAGPSIAKPEATWSS
jgi:hypothetical protein